MTPPSSHRPGRGDPHRNDPASQPTRRRVRVTSPQTRIALSRRHRPAQQLLPPADETLDPRQLAAARAMFTRQRQLAIRTLLTLGVLLFGLSGLLAAWPLLDTLTIAHIPASWLLLMAGSYPLLLLIAACHVRRAEHMENHHP